VSYFADHFQKPLFHECESLGQGETQGGGNLSSGRVYEISFSSTKLYTCTSTYEINFYTNPRTDEIKKN
jgi:hypothetical protein